MKFYIIFIKITFFVFMGAFAQASLEIIPAPAMVEKGIGYFSLDHKTPIISKGETKQEADYLATILEKGFGKESSIKTTGTGINLILNPSLNHELGEEGYKFVSDLKQIRIEAATNTGIFYGIQSLRQLMPAAFEFEPQWEDVIKIPVVEITDKPRFSWRAFMLDESRHFKGSEEVKKLLDQMALLKMNKFHWHLTDDQGWRIEIKKYPRLTEIGSVRRDTQTSRKSDERTGVSHGGFYNQDQIKEIVEYAQARHIQIVPEIEMPGHAMAAIAAYPWLGSLGTTKEVPVTFGKLPDSYNVTDPRVYNFLEDVLTEVFSLFPGKVVHIGGDEVKFDAWEKSEKVQAFMKEKGLASPVDLQIYFTNQMSNFINNSGHRMMGWNDIMGDDIHEEREEAYIEVKQQLAKSAIVHFWKGDLKLISEAVTEGYEVVNSNHWDTYLDYDYKAIPLSKAYAFDPIPEGLEEKYHDKILGLGCQMWSEWIPTTEKMHAQIFPRLAAYAEVGWTSNSAKNYEEFIQNLETLKKRWKLAGISYN